MHRGTLRPLYMVLATVIALVAPQAAVAQCLKGGRDTALGDSGKSQVVSYLCKVGEQAAPSLRVEFHRLSEAAAAGVLAGTPWPEVEKVVGKVRVFDNPVKREALGLYEKFGITEERDDAFHFQTFAGPGGTVSDKISAGTGRKRFTYLTYPDTEGLTGQTMALPDDDKIIRTSPGWPPEFKFYYTGEDCTAGNYACILLWRYFKPEDIAKFEERWKAQQAMMQLEDPDGSEPQLDEDGKPFPTPGSAPLKLIAHLTKDGMPSDFMVALGQYSGCGGGYDFSYFPRQMVVDVAVIQNVSAKPMPVGEMLGSQVDGSGLRPPAPAARGVVAAGVVPIPGAIGTLAPGERVLVPLKLTFVAPNGLAKRFTGKLTEARKAYESYEKLPPNSLVNEQATEDNTNPLAKTRESFLPPELPKVTPYSWGPEIALKGLMVDGQRVVLEETSANFLELTAGEGYGSCPFLYAYDDKQRVWVNYGKVIDNADAASKEMTQEVVLSQFTTRFRLQEEELELSQINRVALNVTLRDGSTLLLAPDDERLATKDERYVQILAGRAVNVSFALPHDIEEADVATAKLSITGYYRRYSSLRTVSHDARRSQ